MVIGSFSGHKETRADDLVVTWCASSPPPSPHTLSYNMAILSGVQLRCVDVLLPPGDFRPLVAPPSVELLVLEPMMIPEP